jgi:hypothetical protein
MSDMFVLGKFWISVQLAERNAFGVFRFLGKVLKFANSLQGSHGLTPIGIAYVQIWPV